MNKIKKMPTSKAMPSKAPKHAPPPMKKVNTDMPKRGMTGMKTPKMSRTRKI